MNSLDDLLDFINSLDTHRTINFEFTGQKQTFRLQPGVYSFECWGASGTTRLYSRGKGAYTFGKIRIDSFRTLYAYVGQEGQISSNPTFGGGGINDQCGGGASDIRLEGTDDFSGLISRIMVAGAGGSGDSLEGGGSGGGLVGKNSQNGRSIGATQTNGGIGYYNGSFGYGGGTPHEGDGNGAGGGGYYGGGSGYIIENYGGSGGSSFISGHDGCNAVSPLSQHDHIIHLNQTQHYSGFIFFDTMMIDGDSPMPGINTKTMTGNDGNGHIRISHISNLYINRMTVKTYCKVKGFSVYLFVVVLK